MGSLSKVVGHAEEEAGHSWKAGRGPGWINSKDFSGNSLRHTLCGAGRRAVGLDVALTMRSLSCSVSVLATSVHMSIQQGPYDGRRFAMKLLQNAMSRSSSFLAFFN